jgi:Flp pilus assembly pilin Flp
MQGTRRLLARLWSDERSVASVEYVMLLALISGGIIIGLTYLGGEVSDGLSEAGAWIGDDGLDGCGNDGGGDGTGGAGGSGQGGANTC